MQCCCYHSGWGIKFTLRPQPEFDIVSFRLSMLLSQFMRAHPNVIVDIFVRRLGLACKLVAINVVHHRVPSASWRRQPASHRGWPLYPVHTIAGGSYFFRTPASVLLRLFAALFAAGVFTAADEAGAVPGLV